MYKKRNEEETSSFGKNEGEITAISPLLCDLYMDLCL